MHGEVEYRDIPGFPGCRVGSDGSVWSTRRRFGKGRPVLRLLSQRSHSSGYRVVSMRPAGEQRRHGRNKRCYVHVLVLTAFRGPCPPGLECRHLDGDKANNRLDNLCWGTRRENAADKRRHGAHVCGTRVGSARLNDESAVFVLKLRLAGATYREIKEAVGISEQAACALCKGKSWRHLPEVRRHVAALTALAARGLI